MGMPMAAGTRHRKTGIGRGEMACRVDLPGPLGLPPVPHRGTEIGLRAICLGAIKLLAGVVRHGACGDRSRSPRAQWPHQLNQSAASEVSIGIGTPITGVGDSHCSGLHLSLAGHCGNGWRAAVVSGSLAVQHWPGRSCGTAAQPGLLQPGARRRGRRRAARTRLVVKLPRDGPLGAGSREDRWLPEALQPCGDTRTPQTGAIGAVIHAGWDAGWRLAFFADGEPVVGGITLDRREMGHLAAGAEAASSGSLICPFPRRRLLTPIRPMPKRSGARIALAPAGCGALSARVGPGFAPPQGVTQAGLLKAGRSGRCCSCPRSGLPLKLPRGAITAWCI